MSINKYIFSSLPLWYIIIALLKNTINFEYILVLNSSIHAIISSFFSVAYYTELITEDFYKNTLGISLTYFLYDSINLVKKKDYQLLLHHLVVSISLVPLISPFVEKNVQVKDYYLYIARFFLSEITTIFLNNSWILYNTKQTYTKLFRINTYILLFLTFIIRVCFITYLNYIIYMDNLINFLGLSIPLTLLNYYWFYKLSKKAIKLN